MSSLYPPASPRNGRRLTITADPIGVVRIGTHPGPAPRSAPLEVAGGLLVIDPFAPDAAPHAELTDPTAASWWLPLAFGDEVALAVKTVNGRTQEVTAPTTETETDRPISQLTAAWTPGPYHLPAARLATALWLSQWSPVPLDRELLDIEIGGLYARLDEMIENAQDTARTLLSHSAATLLRAGKAALNPSYVRYSGDDWTADIVLDSVEQAASLLAGDHEHAALTALGPAARARRAAELTRQEQADTALRTLPRPARFQEPGRFPTDKPGWHTSTVDWAQVRPGALAPDDAGVRWRLHDRSDGRLIEVRVAALASAPTGPPPAVRVYAAGTPLPVAIAPMSLLDSDESDGPCWMVMTPVRHHGPADDLTIDVFHESHVSPPRTGNKARLAAAERQAVRDLVELREYRARQDLRELASWSTIVTLGTAPELEAASPAPQTDPLVNRVWSLARAASTASGAKGHESTALAATPRDPSIGGDQAAYTPDLMLPEWRPTLAEWEALRPSRL
ncbi:hypothetical protein ACIRL0_36245 [Streptomyces sp. NPDC102365]|uniref:hypothetical protein n=1 Tax=Streptomyces sp. NPDC102365 TaxID=3366162 RepID=UPI003800764A